MLIILRTLLFAPGNVVRRMEKALQLAADAVVLDLEDAVPLSEKITARKQVADALEIPRKLLAYVRVNALGTGMTIDDLAAVVCPELDGIVLAKVEEAIDLHKVDWYIQYLEEKCTMPPGTIELLPLVENARGVHNAFEIATAVPRVKRLCFGAVDYSADLGVRLTAGGNELFYARSYLVNVSSAAGLEPPIDTVYPNLNDPVGYQKDLQVAVDLGFQGKLIIHPAQIAAANDMFSFSEEEIAYARQVVEAFEKAEEKGHAAITLDDGKFIDYPVAHRSRKILKQAEKLNRKTRD